MCAAYAVGHHLPCTRAQALQKFFHWLKTNTVWEGGKYADVVMREAYRPEGYTPVWCHNADLLRWLQRLCDPCMSNSAWLCVCVVGWEHLTQDN